MRSLFFLAVCGALAAALSAGSFSVVVGFFSNDPLEVYTFDAATGLLNFTQLVDAGVNTAWMTISADKRTLWVANHASNGGGAWSCPMQWSPTLNLSCTSFAALPSPHNPVSMALGNGYLFWTSYEGNSMGSFQVLQDGTLGPGDFPTVAGTNAHQVVLTPTTRYGPRSDSFLVLVPCLGDDTILNDVTGYGCSVPGRVCGGNTAYSASGTGPRHLVVHPSLQLVYVINEMSSTIGVWKLDRALPQMFEPYYVSALPPGIVGNASEYAGAEIALNARGSVLYVSNRGLLPGCNSSIAAFAVDPATGSLTAIGWYDGDGAVQFPRHFMLSEDGGYLLVANQRGNSISTFLVLPDGSLRYMGTVPTRGNAPAFVLAVAAPTPSAGNGASTAAAGLLALTILVASSLMQLLQ
jgi:6-phosphogluconolactonase (cycloisomerase 2 family)